MLRVLACIHAIGTATLQPPRWLGITLFGQFYFVLHGRWHHSVVLGRQRHGNLKLMREGVQVAQWSHQPWVTEDYLQEAWDRLERTRRRYPWTKNAFAMPGPNPRPNFIGSVLDVNQAYINSAQIGNIIAGGPDPWFDAAFYGALGTGAGDDTKGIATALSLAAANGGGDVYLNPGVYNISSTLNLATFKGVRLRGSGVTTILRPVAGFVGTTVININQNQCEVRDLAIIPGSSTYTLNPAVDGITFVGPANTGVVQNVWGFYNNGWFINAIPTGATGVFGLTLNSLYANGGKGGIHESSVGVAGNPFSAFFNNVWMDHMKGAECFFFDSVHDVDGNNVFGVQDNNAFSCLRINGLSAGVFMTNVDIGGLAGYTGDTILIDRDGSLNVPQFITFIGGVCTVQGRGANIWANGCDFTNFTFLQSATDGVIVNGGSRLGFHGCHWEQSNTSAGTGYDINNQNAAGFVHLTEPWFNSSSVTAVFNGIGGAQWFVLGGHNLPAVTLTAGTAPVFMGFQNGGGTAPVSTLPNDLNFSTAGTGVSNPNGDLKLNAKATNNVLINVGGSTQAFIGASGILTVVAGNGIDVSSAGTLKVGPTNATAIAIGGHLVSTASGTPATSNLGANVTSATFTGNDVRGTIAIVMSGALAANTRVCTATFAVSYGATSPKVTLVDQTSAVGLTIVNSYVLSQSTGVSFDIAFDQALGAGTYTLDYIVIG